LCVQKFSYLFSSILCIEINLRSDRFFVTILKLKLLSILESIIIVRVCALLILAASSRVNFVQSYFEVRRHLHRIVIYRLYGIRGRFLLRQNYFSVKLLLSESFKVNILSALRFPILILFIIITSFRTSFTIFLLLLLNPINTYTFEELFFASNIIWNSQHITIQYRVYQINL